MNDMHETIKEKTGKRLNAAAVQLEADEVIADDMTGKLRAAADDAGRAAKKYTEATVDFVKENPFYIALGVAALGAAGAFFFRKEKKPVRNARKRG